MACDILNFEWTSRPSRDRLAATLVSNYLREAGFQVKERSIFNFIGYMILYRPKLVFITNTTGAPENNLLAKVLSRWPGVKLISFVSEGNFKLSGEALSEFIWGWNRKKILFEDLNLQWTDRTREATLKVHPELSGKVLVSGGIGFDNYRIQRGKTKDQFLRNYRKDKYRKVVGIGCWDFGPFYDTDPRYDRYVGLFSPEASRRFRCDRDAFNEEIIKLIEAKQDWLFLLKEHPGTMIGRFGSAIEGAESYPNVLIVKNEESILDCITVSDVWCVYESTTALEAWLLDKPTCLLNPSGIDFIRDNLFRGSPAFMNADQLASALKNFCDSGVFPGFENLASVRDSIIKDSIQWADGFNHVRAGNEIIRVASIGKKGSPQRARITTRDTLLLAQLEINWLWGTICRAFECARNESHTRGAFSKYEMSRYACKVRQDQQKYYIRSGFDMKKLETLRCR